MAVLLINEVKDIYKNGRTTKPKAYIALGPGLTRYNVITAVDSYLHRSRRQLVGQAITERSMRVFEPTMIEQVNIFVRNLLYESRRSNAVNMTKKATLPIRQAASAAWAWLSDEVVNE
jgi:cytochrome P450